MENIIRERMAVVRIMTGISMYSYITKCYPILEYCAESFRVKTNVLLNFSCNLF